jgi:hypothetical protein
MKPLSRRMVLRGAGATLALPFLELMQPKRAAAQAAAPRRLFLFHYPHGTFLPDWFPSGSGTSWTPSLLMRRQATDPAAVDADLESIRNDIVVISGLSNAAFRHDAHVAPNNAFLTATADRSSWAATGPSVDEVVAGAVGGGTPFPALRASLYQNIAYDMNTTVCFGDGGRPIQPVFSPRSLYGMLTGLVQPSGSAPGGGPQAFRRSVIDYVKTDLTALQARCGVGDRRLIDEHLSSVRDLELRLGQLEPVQCDLPDLSAQLAELPDPTPLAPIWPDTSAAMNLPLRSDVLQRLLVIALRCDLTRVVVLTMGPSSCRMTYPFLNMGNTDDHEFSHLQRDPTSRTHQLQWNTLARWRFAEFAHLINKLKAPEATGGTLLDSTVVVCGSELANGAGHTADLLPMVVAGNVGGLAAASARNRHLVVPCNPNTSIFNNPLQMSMTSVGSMMPGLCTATTNTPLANLWLTVLQAMGVQRTSFGNSTGTLSGLWV